MSKLDPSPGVHLPGRTLELVIVQSILIGFSLLIVGLRLITRFLIVKSPGWDDYAVILATITAIAETSLTMSTIRYGAGLHHQTPFHISSTLKLFYFARILYALTVTSIKISILLLYLRLFPGPRIRLCIKAVIVLVYTGFTVLTSLWIFMCHPVSHAWLPSSSRECLDRSKLFQANAIFGLLVNVIIIVLPMPVIWKLHMSLRKRLVVLGIFAIGLVPCGSLVARLSLPLTAVKFDSDPTWWIIETEEWVLAEYTTGLICASLIHLKPLVMRILPHLHKMHREISASKLITHNAPPHIHEAFSRMDDKKYGYGSLRSFNVSDTHNAGTSRQSNSSKKGLRLGTESLPPTRRTLAAARFSSDNPLHISLFPPHVSNPSANLHFSLLLNSSLDIFEERAQDKNRVDQDLGCLQNVDERLSIWGWETGTGARFAIIVDVWGKEGRPHGPGRELLPVGVKDADLKPAFRALQTAYIRLLQNPFYVPDDHTPMAAANGARGKGGMITSRKFVQDVERIGNAWRPGLGFV